MLIDGFRMCVCGGGGRPFYSGINFEPLFLFKEKKKDLPPIQRNCIARIWEPLKILSAIS